jgi:hypothetical protein
MKIKLIFWIELQISGSYFLFFLGFFLVFVELLPPKYLPIFAVPYLIVSILLFFSANDSNIFLAQKKFAIFEGLQLALIAAKFSIPEMINWNYTLIFFMAGAIYLTVLGLLLTIILSCSLFGFLYSRLESWKIKSLVWMTWYYLFTGLTFIYLIKGVIEFYDDENVIAREQTSNYVMFHSTNTEILATAAIMLIVLNFVNFLMHVFWADDIKKYLTKVIYKNELRKEISLRTLSKNFSFKVIQYSSVFFKKQGIAAKEELQKIEEKNEAMNEKNDQIAEKKKIQINNVGEAHKHEDTECIVCYDQKPNILHDPCGHGGLCKACALEYIRNENTCMFCRVKIQKLYLIEYSKEEGCHYAKGEIKLKF